jgi:hypothetical protein|nr:MAG TPA: hypothetical protein [Crassvirales sp.]
MSTKEIALINLSDASATLVILRYNLDMLIDRCEFENRYPSIQELRNLREHIDDTSTYIARAQEQINEPTRTSKTWIS